MIYACCMVLLKGLGLGLIDDILSLLMVFLWRLLDIPYINMDKLLRITSQQLRRIL